MDRNTFTNQRDISPNKSKAVELLQLWQELKAREKTAQQHNRQLLQQFEEAQHTLREMLTLTNTMKTIRMKYERYLEESSPQWPQQQLKEKTQAPPREEQRMEDILKSCLKIREAAKSSVDELLLSQGPASKPQKIAAPQKHCRQNSHLYDNRDGSPHLPYMQSPHPQSQKAMFPIRFSSQAQGSSHIPPSVLPPPIFSYESQLHHLPSMPSHRHLWPKQDPPGRASSQPDQRWSGTAGAAGIPSGPEGLWGRLHVEEPPPEGEVAQVVGEEAERDTTTSSNREREVVSRRSNLPLELEVKPVRLSNCAAESSETSRESSQGSRERRKRRGRVQRTSSNQERHSSQGTSRTSSAKVGAAVTVVQSSESDVSSEKGRTRRRSRGRSVGLAAGSARADKVANNRDDSGDHKEEGHPAGEESRKEDAEDQSSEKPESCTEESGSQQEEETEDTETGGEMSDSSEESSVAEKDEDEHEKDLGEGNEEDDGDRNEEDQRVEEQEERDDNVSENQNTTEDEEETGPEGDVEEEEGDKEEASVMLENEEDGKRGSASTRDEEDKDDSKGGENKMTDRQSDKEEEGGGTERGDEAGELEERDSDDSIISPQNKSIKRHIIPEVREEEEGSRTGSPDDDSEFSDDDIEHLLAPQERSQNKEEEDLRADEKPKALCDKVEIFQVEMDTSTKSDHGSDSEFDHFYD